MNVTWLSEGHGRYPGQKSALPTTLWVCLLTSIFTITLKAHSSHLDQCSSLLDHWPSQTSLKHPPHCHGTPSSHIWPCDYPALTPLRVSIEEFLLKNTPHTLAPPSGAPLFSFWAITFFFVCVETWKGLWMPLLTTLFSRPRENRGLKFASLLLYF